MRPIRDPRREARILAQLHEAVVCLADDGTVIAWNDAAAGQFGWAEREVLGRHHTERLPTEDAKKEAETLVRRAREGEIVRG